MEILTVDYRAQLTELPESVGDLYALKELIIHDCFELTAIPESFGNLICRKARGEEGSALERVSFSDCPLLRLPLEIEDALKILNYTPCGIE